MLWALLDQDKWLLVRPCHLCGLHLCLKEEKVGILGMTPGIINTMGPIVDVADSKHVEKTQTLGNAELRKATADVSGFLCLFLHCIEEYRTSPPSPNNRACFLTGFGPDFEEICQLHVQLLTFPAKLLIRSRMLRIGDKGL